MKKNTLENMLKYFWVLSIILTGSTMYGVLKTVNDYGIISYTFRQISLIITALLLLYMVLKHNYKARNFNIFLIVLSFFLIYLLATRYLIPSALEGMCIPILLYILLAGTENSDRLFVDFMNSYENIMLIFMCFSLFFYFFGVVLHCIPYETMQFTNNGWLNNCDNYFYLQFVNEWQKNEIMGITVYRNIGIFMEGPGYAGAILYAFWWELFGHNKYSLSKIFIMILNLVTTFSTKAYAFSAILLTIFLLSKASNQIKIWRKLKKLFLPIIFLASFVVVIVSLRYKINQVNDLGATSWQIRLADYSAAFKTWVSNPVFGAGFYNLEAIYKLLPRTFMKGDPTAGIINILAYGGLYMGIGNILALAQFFFKFKNTKFNTNIYSFLVLLFLLLSTSSMQYSYIYLFFISVGLTLPNNPNIQNNDR